MVPEDGVSTQDHHQEGSLYDNNFTLRQEIIFIGSNINLSLNIILYRKLARKANIRIYALNQLLEKHIFSCHRLKNKYFLTILFSELCEPGTCSPSGQKPCMVCQIGTFQPNYGSTSCLLCGAGLKTRMAGSTGFKDCITKGR